MKLGAIADQSPDAQNALHALQDRYDVTLVNDANSCPLVDTIITLGGDGFMLRTLHHFMNCKIPIFGMNCGTVGFLMNRYDVMDLTARITSTKPAVIHPLKMIARDAAGNTHEAMAINEVSLLRQTGQTAKIAIHLDDNAPMEEVICDGMIVSTPAGSSAYNFSAGGPILPLRANILALTPISPFRPRRWRGALLPEQTHIRLDVINHEKRPVQAQADFQAFNDVVSVQIEQNLDDQITLLFDPGHSLEERLLREQFTP